MRKENKYDFRKKLLTVHDSDVRDFSRKAKENELTIHDGVVINIGKTDDIVVKTAAEDFVDFFKVSMGMKASVSCADTPEDGAIVLALASDVGFDLGSADGYKGFCIQVEDSIKVYGNDGRGLAAALYYLEDMMCYAKGPFLERGETRKKPIMTPTMVHSGYALDDYPDEYLNRIAHEGRDTILVFTWDVNKCHTGFLDFNDLIARAARYGLDVYAYSFLIGGPHPDEPGAEEAYDAMYGKLFRECPGLKGVTMVGEVTEFKSKDPHVSKFRCRDKVTDDLPDGKLWPGWYPCEDLPQWVSLVSKVIRKVKPDADIVLWSYNWGFNPKEARVKLIENLPTDITLEATWEMFDYKEMGDVKSAISDYSLSYVGPSPYFASEAVAAKKRGIKLYTMSQAAGVTWDFGAIPYEPMPYQWLRRYEKMRQAIAEWDLRGGMETHHHGFYPSLITKFSKHAFLSPDEPLEEILDKVFVMEYGEENLDKVREGFRLWSEAINYYTPTEGEFCGAGRIGPAYPFCLFHHAKPEDKEKAFFGSAVVNVEYCNSMLGSYYFISRPPAESFINLRQKPELESLYKMYDLMEQGVAVFDSIENPNRKLKEVINLGKYLTVYMKTIVNAKEWNLLKCRMTGCFDKQELLNIVDEMEALLKAEQANAAKAIPYAQADSRLGWEPTMLYLADAEHIEWKIRQIQYVLDFEITKLRKAINF